MLDRFKLLCNFNDLSIIQRQKQKVGPELTGNESSDLELIDVLIFYFGRFKGETVNGLIKRLWL